MKIFSLVILSLMLTGCGMFSPKIEDKRPDPVIVVNKTFLAYECPQPPQIDDFNSRDIVWDVASRKELDGIILELMADYYEGDDDPLEDEDFLALISVVNMVVGDFFFHPDDEVRWSLSADDYADSGRNTSDVIKALKQLKAVVRHYKTCIDESEAAVRRANAQATTEVSE